MNAQLVMSVVESLTSLKSHFDAGKVASMAALLSSAKPEDVNSVAIALKPLASGLISQLVQQMARGEKVDFISPLQNALKSVDPSSFAKIAASAAGAQLPGGLGKAADMLGGLLK
jgi:hypothetical protein